MPVVEQVVFDQRSPRSFTIKKETSVLKDVLETQADRLIKEQQRIQQYERDFPVFDPQATKDENQSPSEGPENMQTGAADVIDLEASDLEMLTTKSEPGELSRDFQ
jgi:hypothetical protein